MQGCTPPNPTVGDDIRLGEGRREGEKGEVIMLALVTFLDRLTFRSDIKPGKLLPGIQLAFPCSLVEASCEGSWCQPFER